MKSPVQSLKELSIEISSLPQPVFVLVLGQFCNRFGAFVFPFFGLYLKDKSFELSEIAGVMAALGTGHFLGPIAGGYLADSIGRRNTIVVSLLASGSSLIGMYFVDNYILLLVVGAFYGFSVFIFGAPASALLTDLVPEEKRVTAFALFRLAINAGFAAGPAVAGFLYVKSPMLIFLGDALTTFLFAGLAYFFLPHGLRSIEGKATFRGVVDNWRNAVVDAFGNLRFRRFLMAVLLMGVSFSQIFTLLSIYASDRGLSPATYGWIMGLNGLLIIFVEIPAVQWLKGRDPRNVLMVGYALIGVGCLIFGFAETRTGFVWAMIVFTIGEIVALPIGMAYSSSLAPTAYRGRYFGLRGMTWAASNLIASGGVWLYGHMGASWWLLSGVFGVAGAWVIRRE
ncbi:MFS transporter [Pelagicoccus sp. SDUM812002]|uniref:MFS transporter n=1 Tax=Pelagicoccus sp. SDUM812002 TaxID=3041266 RepID=UPI00280FE126|nr:MFS transporter [Pelagicoccus sp. SDUM812002]MDQ8187936.1 MFS transporter [Pelagicoccus sp. SDUM812002]